MDSRVLPYECTVSSARSRPLGYCAQNGPGRFPNKQLIAQYLTDFGEDSDIGRVRVLGLPPMADELPFIGWARILAAQQRQVVTFDDERLVAGFDASGSGAAWNVVRFRRGLDPVRSRRCAFPGSTLATAVP